MSHSRSLRLDAILKDYLDQIPDPPTNTLTPARQEALQVEHAPGLQQNPESLVSVETPTGPEAGPPQPCVAQDDADIDSKRFVWLTDPALSDQTSKDAATTAPPHELLHSQLEYGQLGPFDQSYCPVIELSRYCYKYIRGTDSQRVASALFDGGKFWARGWNIFHVQHPDYNFSIGLVAESQLQLLLQEINRTFNHLDLKVDRWQREHGFLTKFPPHPHTHPRYLGRCWSKDEFSGMMENAPGYGVIPPSEDRKPPPDDRTLEAFKAMMEEMAQLQKAKSKAAKEKRIREVTISNQAMTQQLRRAQCYLGLLPKDEVQSLSRSRLIPASVAQVPAVDVTVPVPYPVELAPVIISIDVEAYERDHKKATEVGICVLDTLDLDGTPPGVNGANWRKLTRNRHLRIIEHKHLINRDFVEGCPGNFEFGESEFVGLMEIAGILKDAFGPPYSKSLGSHSIYDDPAPHLANASERTGLERRNIVILGHDPNQDISYFHRLGFNPLTVPHATTGSPGLLEVLDTAALYRSYSRLPQSRKLGAVLAELDIDGWFCHNAGNDAVYTMQAMLAIAVRDAAQRGDEESSAARAARVDNRIQEELQEQEDLKRAAVKGFDDEAGEDGGVPLGGSPPTGAHAMANLLDNLGLGGDSSHHGAAHRGEGRRASRGSSRAYGRAYPGSRGQGREGW